MTYYVYYIPDVKIGCTNNLKRRVEKQQGYKKYKILATTNCLKTASSLEKYYQKKYNYKIDNKTYEQLILEKMIHVSRDTITFKKTKEKTLAEFIFPSFLEIDKEIINFSDELINWVKKNNFKSQYNEERYVYKQSLLNFYFSKNESIYDKIRVWAKDRVLYNAGDSKTQFVKLSEEMGELAQGILKKDKPEITDAIGDLVVVLTNLAHLEGLKIEDCIASAYNVIKNRTGKMSNGTFIKDK